MLKYKTGDSVKVLRGKDKGREGVIERIFPKKGTALVEGINLYKRHIKKAVGFQIEGGKKLRFSKKSKEILDKKEK